MVELLEKYSLIDIVVVIVGFSLAIKGMIDFLDWIKDKLKLKFGAENNEQKRQEYIDEKFKEIDDFIALQNDFKENISEKLKQTNDQLDLLINSDKDAIKSYITEKHHHFCYEQKWIDDYSMDCIEKRYSHYLDENGNSFVADLMKDLRELDRKPM